MTARRAIGLLSLAGVGWLLAGAGGAVVATLVAVAAWRAPAAPLVAATGLLVVAAVATLVEVPLSAGKAAVADFPLRHDVAATAGRWAGVALVVACILLAAREARGRRRPASQPQGVPLRRAVARNAPGLAAALVAAALAASFAGEGAAPVLSGVLVAGAAAVVMGGRQWRA